MPLCLLLRHSGTWTREPASVTLAPYAPDRTAWMPRSCCSSDVVGASMSYPQSRSAPLNGTASHEDLTGTQEHQGSRPSPLRRPMTNRSCSGIAQERRERGIHAFSPDRPGKMARTTSHGDLAGPHEHQRQGACADRPAARHAARRAGRPRSGRMSQWLYLSALSCPPTVTLK